MIHCSHTHQGRVCERRESKAIEKLEGLILENHLESCVPEGIREGREEAVIAELVQLYNLAGNR